MKNTHLSGPHGRLLLSCLIAFASLLLATSHALASEIFPCKPIRLVLPFADSGTGGAVAHLVAASLSKQLGQPVTPDFLPGGNGSHAMELLAQAAPDGYTLGLATASSHGASPAFSSRGRYDVAKDFTAIAGVVSIPYVIMVDRSIPAANLRDFIYIAQNKPRELSFGSTGVGSQTHAFFVWLMSQTDIRLISVPFPNNAAARTAAAQGRVDIFADGYPGAKEILGQGKLRPLAVVSPVRLPAMPNVSTMSELGFKGIPNFGWFGIVGPAKMPFRIIAMLNSAMQTAMQKPHFLAQVKAMQGSSLSGTPQQFEALIRASLADYKNMSRLSGIPSR